VLNDISPLSKDMYSARP